MVDEKAQKGRFLENCQHLFAAFFLLFIALLSAIISLPFGLLVSFVAAVGFTLARPTAVVTMIAAAFLFQNTLIAILTPLVSSADEFDMLRGINFVLVVATSSIAILAAFMHPERLNAKMRRWLLLSIAVILVIAFYLAIGAIRSVPRDALIYFRNSVTPIFCFLTAFIIAAFYQVETRGPIIALGVLAVLYGYLELFLGLDFLELFHGDDYIRRRIIDQIESGYWERVLRETGFVLSGLEDVMMTTLFNIPGTGDLMPRVLRLSGPNFHPISFAYALSIIAIWQIFQNRWLFAAFAFPVLIIVGSKGALIALLSAIALKVVLRLLPFRLAIISFLIGVTLYLLAAIIYGRSVGDYHVLGLLAGLRDFSVNPLGAGLGIGGNLSSAIEDQIDWTRWQAQGIADIPLESAIGVMLYQMGVGAFVFLGFLFALGKCGLKFYRETGSPDALFAFHITLIISSNAVLQEEAFFSPLALGLALLLVGSWMGRALSTTR